MHTEKHYLCAYILRRVAAGKGKTVDVHESNHH